MHVYVLIDIEAQFGRLCHFIFVNQMLQSDFCYPRSSLLKAALIKYTNVNITSCLVVKYLISLARFIKSKWFWESLQYYSYQRLVSLICDPSNKKLIILSIQGLKYHAIINNTDAVLNNITHSTGTYICNSVADTVLFMLAK